MPLFSKLRRSKEKDSYESEKPPLKPSKPADAQKLHDFSKTFRNSDHLNQCEGCTNVEVLIRRQLEQQKNGAKKSSPSGILHNSFAELDDCAQKCNICRVFRQALVLTEVTFDGVKQLRSTPGGIYVPWRETTDAEGASKVSLNVEIRGQPGRVGIVELNNRNDIAHLALVPDGLNSTVIQQAKGWLDNCRQHHVGSCDNLRWSSENPKIILELISDDLIRLCENEPGDYVALSYCWGMQYLSKAECDMVERSKTKKHNLEERRYPFSMSILPTTVRDALHIIRAMGVRYAWVDSLCIIQDNLSSLGVPEGVETMHLIYSNALFTLCASATTRATASLLSKREAWKFQTEPCRLGGRWLTTPDMSLSELRLKSPLAGRAWTLQEERLSPRMLYVSSDRLHWSCAKGHELELKPTYGGKTTTIRQPLYSTLDQMEMPLAQEFLLACYSGKSDRLPFYWADIVKSYAARSMSVPADRLTALSGVAAKYLSASQSDEYLAGLWANHLAEGLAWRVLHPIKTEGKSPPAIWPSWSWAITPAPTSLETLASGRRSQHFQRIDVKRTQSSEFTRLADDAIKTGEQVKQIRVMGRTRPLWKHSSFGVSWSTVSRMVDGREVFAFGSNPDQDMHAVERGTGRVLVYEERKREVVGQVDFEGEVERMEANPGYVKALELGVTTMLLLREVEDGTWKRVGVAWDVREDYFVMAERETLVLS